MSTGLDCILMMATGTGDYNKIIMGMMASQIISLTIVYSTVYSGADQRQHESFASLAFRRRIHRGPVNSPHKWPVTRKMFPFDDVIILLVTFDDRMRAKPSSKKINHSSLTHTCVTRASLSGVLFLHMFQWLFEPAMSIIIFRIYVIIGLGPLFFLS